MDFLKFEVVAFMEFGLISWKVNISPVLCLSCINSSAGSSGNSIAVLMALCLQRPALEYSGMSLEHVEEPWRDDNKALQLLVKTGRGR